MVLYLVIDNMDYYNWLGNFMWVICYIISDLMFQDLQDFIFSIDVDEIEGYLCCVMVLGF